MLPLWTSIQIGRAGVICCAIGDDDGTKSRSYVIHTSYGPGVRSWIM